MYEYMTFDVILKQMLDRVPSTIDTREGSIVYDAIAPAAAELQLMYIELDVILNETFANTASRAYLIRRAMERGLSPLPATFAVLQGTFNVDVAVGARFSGDTLNYIVTEKNDDGTYAVQCETAGAVGNGYFGRITPIEYIDGLTSALLTGLLIPGEDEEETEAFRARYFASFDAQAYGGNVADYIEKTNALDGVGGTKVTPVWNGGGTVKLTIVDAAFNPATQTLIDSVQAAIDPTGTQEGLGIAPIGHVVTVDTATAVPIVTQTHVQFQAGYTWETVRGAVETTVADYLTELRKSWQDNDTTVVRIAQIDARMLAVDGIIDVTDTTINGVTGNIEINAYSVPTFGGVVHVA